jgi:hypothetical protein
MKKYIPIALLLSATIVYAEDKPATYEEICAVAEEVSRAAMDARQAGVPLKNILKIFPAERDSAENMFYYITLLAYNRPRYETESVKEKAINDFADYVYIECLNHKLR